VLLQGNGLRVVPIFNHRQVTPQFFQQMNQFGHLLLGQQVQLKTEMTALAVEPGGPVSAQ